MSKKSILVSIIIHGIFLLPVLLIENKEKPSPPVNSFLVELNKPVAPKSQRKTRGQGKKRKGRRNKKLKSRAGNISLSQLVPSTIDSTSRYGKPRRFNHGDQGLSVADNSSAPWGEGGGEFGRLSDYVAYEKVAFTMDRIVEYPPQLAYRKIGGFVNSRLVIDEKGRCNWKQSYIKGNNPMFRFYVLNVLKQFCKGDFWHRLQKRKSSNVDFSFHFDTYSKEASLPKVNGNVILFQIPGHQDKGNWRLGPLQGHFLFPNALLMNPTWIVENWNYLVHGEDPLAPFKEPETDSP